MVCCSTGCARFTLMFVNLMFGLMGVALVAVGVYGYLQTEELQDESEVLASLPVKTAAVAVIAVGAVLALLATCGGMGVRKNKGTRTCLSVYILVLGLLVAAQMALAVWIYTSPDGIVDEVRDEWKDDSNFDEVVAFQDWLECCGFEGVDASRPCADRNPDDTCPTNQTATFRCEPSYTTNCKQAMEDWLDDNITIIAIVLLVLVGLQVFGLLAASVLVCRKDENSIDQFYADDVRN